MVKNGLKCLALFIALALLHVLMVNLRNEQVIGRVWIETMESLLFFGFIAAGVWLARGIPKPPVVRNLFIFMLVLAILGRILEVTNEIAYLNTYPLLGAESALNGPVRHFFSSLVILLILAIGFFALVAFERSHRRLAASEERLKLVLDVTSTDTWEWDLARQEIHVNPAWKEKMGLDPDTPLQAEGAVADRIHPEDLAALKAARIHHFNNDTPFYDVEYRFKDANGAWLWVFERGRTIERAPSGRAARAAGLFMDITERKHREIEQATFERKVQHTQKLESLGVLAGGIAHDFNTLLAAIVGNTDLAMHEMDPDSNASRHLRDVHVAADHAARLCNQMLAYAGRGQIVVKVISVSGLVRGITPLLQSIISKNVSLVTKFSPGLPAIEADVAQLQQVIMNLITNAAEAIGNQDPGTVTVSTGTQYCGVEALRGSRIPVEGTEGTYVYLEVTDTGTGMDAETQAKMFEPFFTTKITGRGLGLSATLGIVRGHRGAIFLESVPGAGTTIRVLFPASKKSAVSPSEPPSVARAPREGDATVLLVDDEEPIRDMARNVLQRKGYKVYTAADGREALNQFEAQRGKIDCIVLDLSMQGMDGEETVRQFRERSYDVPIVISSGYSDSEIAERFLGAGLAGFIQKPYRAEQLLAVTYKAICGQRNRSQSANSGD